MTSLNLVTILISKDDGFTLVDFISSADVDYALKIEHIFTGECFIDSWDRIFPFYMQFLDDLTMNTCRTYCGDLGESSTQKSHG